MTSEGYDIGDLVITRVSFSAASQFRQAPASLRKNDPPPAANKVILAATPARVRDIVDVKGQLWIQTRLQNGYLLSWTHAAMWDPLFLAEFRTRVKAVRAFARPEEERD